MATNGEGAVQSSGKSVIKRRYRSALERRQIVEETLQPGASVAIIARVRCRRGTRRVDLQSAWIGKAEWDRPRGIHD